MLNYLVKGTILGVPLLVIFVIIERIRIAFGKEIIIDKLLAYLEKVYQLTAPKDHEEMNLRGCNLPEKIQVVRLYFNDTKSK